MKIDIMKNPVELVPISKLSKHPFLANIYKTGNLDTLMQSLEQEGQLHEIFYDVNYRIISGGRVWEAGKRINMTHLKGRMVDTTDEAQIHQLIIAFNQQRKKTFKEEIAEAKYMLGLLGKNQGKRREDLIIDEKDPQLEAIKSDRFALAAKYCGNQVSGQTLRKAIAIDDFEYKHPDNKLNLIELVDKYQLTVSKAYTLMRGYLDKLEANGKIKGEKANPTNFTKSDLYHIIHGDCLAADIAENSIDTIGTSCPYYGLRDYRTAEQRKAAEDNPTETELGQEKTVDEFITNFIKYGRKFYIQLKDTGSFFLNVGPTYSNQKNYIVAHRIAVALCDVVGFHLLNEIVIEKTNALPQTTRKRLQPSYELIFHFVKNPEKHHYKPFKVLSKDKRIELSKIKRPNKNGGYDIGDYNLSQGYKKFADFVSLQDQAEIIKHCSVVHESSKVKALDPEVDHPAIFSTCLMLLPILTTTDIKKSNVFYDPFGGTGSSLITAILLGRKCIMTEKQERYVRIAKMRLEHAAKEYSADLADYIENMIIGPQIIDISSFKEQAQERKAA